MSRPTRTMDTIMDAVEAGGVFARSELYDVLTPAQVNPALRRLADLGRIAPLGHGLWHVPTVNKLLRRGSSGPSVDAIVGALGRSSGARFLPGDMYAANMLGLVNPVGVRPLFLTDSRVGESTTDAATRERIGANVAMFGNREIHFRTVPVSRLAWAGRPAATVVQAAHHLAGLDAKGRKTKRQVADLRRIVAEDPMIASDLRDGVALLKGDVREMVAPVLREIADRAESPDVPDAKRATPQASEPRREDRRPFVVHRRSEAKGGTEGPRPAEREPGEPEVASHGLR